MIQALTLALTFTWPVPFTAPLAQADEPPPAERRRRRRRSRSRPPPCRAAGAAAASRHAAPARLEPLPAAQAETVVRAAPAAPRADQAATVSVVVPDESPRAYDDLASLLAEVPGVNVVRTGSLGKLTTITLRGSNPDQVRVYVDGVPVNIAAGGGVDISTLPIGDVERVDVYRGSAPLEFGESALGGSSRSPRARRAAPGATHAPAPDRSARCSATSAAAAASAGFGSTWALHGFSSRGDFPYVNDNMTALNPADDMMLPRPNNDVLQGDGVLRAELALAGRRTLDLGVIGFARDEGLPGTGGAPTKSARFQHDARPRLPALPIARRSRHRRPPVGAPVRVLAARSTERPRARERLGRRVADARHDHARRRQRPRGAAARRVGQDCRRARGAARGLPAGQRSGRRSRRRAGAPGRGRRGRGDRSALALGQPGSHPVRTHRGDAGRGQPPRRARRSPAGHAGRVPQVARAARGAGPPAGRTADAEDRRQGERRPVRPRPVVHRALRQRHRVRAGQRRSVARAGHER